MMFELATSCSKRFSHAVAASVSRNAAASIARCRRAAGVNDMRLLAQLGWRIANQAEMPKYNEGDQFAQVRK